VNELDRWTAAVRAALGLPAPAGDGGGAEQRLVLDLARDVAHGVLRPAAPMTAYLVGLAVGRGADPAAATALVGDLAAGWSVGDQTGAGPAERGTNAP
jgi:uncharacterized protein DUF6457